MNIILCGYKSCGKSTVAKAYSQSFPCRFIDTDSLIIDKFQSSHGKKCVISEIYSAVGELEFRQLEADVIRNISKVENSIIATGGGAVIDDSNVKYLKSLGKIIYLQLDHEKLYDRLLTADNTPSFINEENKKNNLRDYVISRNDIYEGVSDYIININNKATEEIISIVYQYRVHHGQ